MAQHVDEVQHHDIQRRLNTFELPDHTLAEITFVDLPIVETLTSAIPIQKGLNQLFLVLVLGLFIPFFHPILRIHLLDLQRQQTRENGIAGILRCRRQNRGVLLFMTNRVELADKRLDGLPLVITEIINHA